MIGINLQVNAEQVRNAKRDVSFLNSELRKTEDIGEDLSIGGDGLERSSDLVRKLGEDMRRLRSIAGAGGRQGGVLKTEQFVQAEKISKQIRENFKSLSGDIGKAREELNRLISEKGRLNKIGTSGKYESPDSFMTRQSRLQDIEGQISARETELAKMDKLRAKAGIYGRMAGEAGDTIGGFGALGSPGVGGMIGRKMLGAGMTLLGGISAISLLREAYDQAKFFVPAEADLMMRGGRNIRNNLSELGYKPMEHVRTLDTLNRHLGMAGDDLGVSGTAVKQFSRGFGLSTDITSGALTAALQAVGFTTAEAVSKHLTRLQGAARQGGIGGRLEEFLGLNSRLLSMIAQSSGGRELTGGQIDWVTGLQSALWSRPGMAGKGESGAGFISALDQGLRQGGNSPGEQLFFFRAAERAMGRPIRTPEDYERFLKMQDEGIRNKDYLRGSLELARQEFGGNGKGGLSTVGRLSVRKLFGLRDEQVRMANEMIENGIFDEKNYRRFLEGGDLQGRAALAMRLPGNDHRDVEARELGAEFTVGGGMLQATDLLKKGALDAADALGQLTDRATRFLRPELSPEEQRERGVLGVGHGSPWKPNPLAAEAQQAPEWARGFTDEVRALRDLIERQENQIRRVEVINQPQQLIHPGFPKGSGR